MLTIQHAIIQGFFNHFAVTQELCHRSKGWGEKTFELAESRQPSMEWQRMPKHSECVSILYLYSSQPCFKADWKIETKAAFIPALENSSRHFYKEVPTGRVTVGMASLYLESLRGVHAHLKPLQASVEVSTEHAPPTGTVCKGKSCPL